jgi:hypothetical protein
MPPAEPFAIFHICVTSRMAPVAEDRIPPRTDLSVRGFKLFSTYESAEVFWAVSLRGLGVAPSKATLRSRTRHPNLSLDKGPAEPRATHLHEWLRSLEDAGLSPHPSSDLLLFLQTSPSANVAIVSSSSIWRILVLGVISNSMELWTES